MTDVTNILGQIEDGDPSAAEKLLPLLWASTLTLNSVGIVVAEQRLESHRIGWATLISAVLILRNAVISTPSE